MKNVSTNPKNNKSLTIAVGFAALVVGTALVSGPALAQQGKAANDGGQVVMPSGKQPVRAKPLYNSVPQQAPNYRYPSGRGANDGGQAGPK